MQSQAGRGTDPASDEGLGWLTRWYKETQDRNNRGLEPRSREIAEEDRIDLANTSSRKEPLEVRTCGHKKERPQRQL